MTQPTPIRRDHAPARPLLLDLFCCAGGAATGYHRAGFDVIGVDIVDRPNYPFTFVRADALEYLAALIASGEIRRFTAVHSSPPCQAGCALTIGTNKSRGWGREHVQLIPELRTLLDATGLPYVIEQPNGKAPSGGTCGCAGRCSGSVSCGTATSSWAAGPSSDLRTRSTGGTCGATGTASTATARTSRRVRVRRRQGHRPGDAGGHGHHVDRRARGADRGDPPAFAEHIGRALLTAVRPVGMAA